MSGGIGDEARRVIKASRVCEWCGRPDCEDLLRGGSTSTGHNEAVWQRRLTATLGPASSVYQSSSRVQRQRTSSFGRCDADGAAKSAHQLSSDRLESSAPSLGPCDANESAASAHRQSSEPSWPRDTFTSPSGPRDGVRYAVTLRHTNPSRRTQSHDRAVGMVDRVATVASTGPSRRTQSQRRSSSKHRRAWNFRNTNGISWTYPSG